MAGAFVAASRAGDGITAAVSSLAITIPASAAAGHVAELYVDADTNPTLTTPTGWTLQRTDDVSTSARTWIFTRAIQAGDAGTSVTLTFGASTRPTAVMIVKSGVTLTGIQTALLSQTTATGTYTLPTLTGVPAGAMVTAAFLRRRTGAAGSITVPSPYTSPTNGDAATAFAAGSNTFLDTGYVETAGGSIGGEAGSTGVTSLGNNYLVSLPAVSTGVNRLKIGDSAPAAIRIGDSTVSKVYVGDVQVWP